MLWRIIMMPFPAFDFLQHRVLAVAIVLLSMQAAIDARAAIVINEIYYDHPGRDNGWEFIELYNPDAIERDVSGLRLEFLDGRTGKVRIVWQAPDGVTIEPGGVALVAGGERLTDPRFMLTGSLENGPDAVRLVGPNGIVDLIGYGDLVLADLYEAEPAGDVEAGESLSRKPDGRDTDDNRADFTPSVPSPGGRNFHTKDLQISLLHETLLPCRGSLFVFPVLLRNVGLERFSGPVAVTAVSVSCGGVSCSERAEAILELDTGCEATFDLRLQAPDERRADFLAALASSTDENPSNDTISVTLNTSPGSIIINEIMYRPAKGGSEWIEVLNTGIEQINLNGWSIEDAAGSRRTIAEGDRTIDTGEFLIIAQYPGIFRERYADCTAQVIDVVGGWPVLNDGAGVGMAESVTLYGNTGMPVELVEYHDMMGEERGRSIERFSELACSSAPGTIWHRCALAAGATPGSENSTRTVHLSARGGLEFDPNPFCPLNDREVVITGSLRQGEHGISVRIFSLEGYEIAHIFGEEGGARIFSCRWDGRDWSGRIVSTGLYICSVEFSVQGGVVCRRERDCIAVVGSGDSY